MVGHTYIPDPILDSVLPFLKPSERAVLLYIARRTYGFGKKEDRISLSQFQHGIVKKNGERIDYGTGLSRASIIQAIHSLERHDIVLKKKSVTENKILKNTYSISEGGSLKFISRVVQILDKGSPNFEHTTNSSTTDSSTTNSLELAHAIATVKKKEKTENMEHVIMTNSKPPKGFIKKAASVVALEFSQMQAEQAIPVLTKPATTKTAVALWQQMVPVHHDTGSVVLTQKQAGQLRHALNRIAKIDKHPPALAVINWTVGNWSKLTSRVKYAYGIENAPKIPHTGFFLTHVTTASHLFTESLQKPAAQKMNISSAATHSHQAPVKSESKSKEQKIQEFLQVMGPKAEKK